MRRQLLTGLLLVVPTLSQSQGYCDPRVNAACYQAWCQGQGGRPVYRGNWGCDMSSARSGFSSGGGGAELGRQIGGQLGNLIRDGLFGDPQQDTARRAAMAEQRRIAEQEDLRRAAEQARQEEARYQRLRTTLLDFNPGPPVSLMGIQPGGGGLQLMIGDEAERSSSPVLADLSRAAAWSTLAARAPTAEDAAVLSDAAFQSLVGGKVDLPPPSPEVKGVPVHPLLPEVESLRKQYASLHAELPNALRPVMDAEQRRELFMRLERQARELEVSAYEGVRKNQARDAAREARQQREKAEADQQRATQAFQQQQNTVNGVAQSLRALLSSTATPPRKSGGYFYLGFEDGSRCFSQNAGPRCDKASAPAGEFESCLADYRRGFSAGEKLKNGMLEEAVRAGRRDGPTGVHAITDPRAEGSCRYEFVMSYNRGYFER